MTQPPPATSNRVLLSLPETYLRRFWSDLELITLPTDVALHDVGEMVEYVYFPEQCLLSVMTVMEDGRVVESIAIGNEGMLGLSLVLGEALATSRWIVQVGGAAQRMAQDKFERHMLESGELRTALGRYALALVDQLGQAVSCNAVHSVPARYARWLLMTNDRIGKPGRFHLTQEFLAQMVGAGRPTVSIAASALQRRELIRYGRGDIELLDLVGLEDAACECYRRMTDRLNGAFGEK